MNFKKRSLILSILVLSIFLLQSTALASAIFIPDRPPRPTTYRVDGYVNNADTGAPLMNARVQIYRGTSTKIGEDYTDNDGYYTYSYTTSLTITLVKSVASKSGFFASTRTGYMLEGRVRLNHNLNPIPIPPTAPTISNVEITESIDYEVTVSWDVAWAPEAYSHSVECYWGTDADLDWRDRIYFEECSEQVTSFSCLVPRELVSYTGGTYYYKVYARNMNNNGSSETTFGPTTVVISNPWESTEIVFIEDCSVNPTPDDDWLRKCGYYYTWPYPLDVPSAGNLLSDGNYIYTDWISTDLPNTHHGPVYHKSITNPFMLESLSEFHVCMERIINDVSEQGSFHISINDIGMRPIVDLHVFDNSTGSHELLIYATYVDEKLDKHSNLIASGITTSWSGEFDIWYEKDVGIVAGFNGGDPVTIADTTVVNKYRSIAHVSMQSTRYDSNQIPNIRLDEISLEMHTFYLQLDLNRASDLRSGPRELPLTRPGPTNEIQMFPSYSEPLTFQFDTNQVGITYYINIDAIPVSYSGTTDTSWIEVRVNGYLADSIELDWDPQIYIDPNTDFEVQNYIHELNWDPNQQVNTIELRACGPNWDPMDIVALRGIWVHCYDDYHYLISDLKQIFPDNGELTYFVPMGSDTLMYFDFEGADGSYVDVFVDGIYKFTHDNPGGLNNVGYDLGDFIRGTLHELTVVYHETTSGISPAIVTMHSSFRWLTVEIDYVEYPTAYNASDGVERHFPAGLEGGIWTSFSEYLTDMWNDTAAYFEAHTHGRLEFIIDDAIPWDQWDQDLENGTGFACSDLVDVGRDWFNHAGDRDYLWAFYGDNLAGSGGYRFDTDFIYPRIYNGWEKWSAIAVQWHHNRSATWHELGHAAHITGDDDSCECPGCVMPYFGVDGDIMRFCQYHWFQTWYNKVGGQSYMWISEWWLL